jgi:zinc transporter ZupT
MAYFLELGGLSDKNAFNATVILSFVMLVGNMVGWVFVERFGRRSTALYGEKATSSNHSSGNI